MDALFKDYENYLNEKSKKNTAMSYMSDLTKFIKELDIRSLTDISKLTSADVNEYIAILKNRGMAYASLARVLASLKKFFSFCSQRGIISENLTFDVSIPQRQRKLPETLTFDEVVKILEAPDTKTVKGIRDKAMLELMYATGAKVSEIIGLKVNDVSLKNEIVLIENGSKNRFVPMGKTAVDSMFAYLKNARNKIPCSDKSDALFLNVYGGPLTRQGFWKIIKYYIELAGVRGNVTAKTLRHSFALHLLDNGADIHSVSEMMGYSDVTSTKIYLKVMDNKIKEVYRKTHPRA